MPRKQQLWVVPQGETQAEPPERLTVAEAAATGKHRDLLIAMRERIATAVTSPDCPPRDLAALTRRLQDIVKEIGAIDAADEQEARRRGDSTRERRSFDASAI